MMSKRDASSALILCLNDRTWFLVSFFPPPLILVSHSFPPNSDIYDWGERRQR